MATSVGAPIGPASVTYRGTMGVKLALLVIASVGIAVCLIAGVSAWRDGEHEAALQQERLQATATVMASVAADAAAEGDKSKAFRVIRSIGAMPGVLYARIDRADGRPSSKRAAARG